MRFIATHGYNLVSVTRPFEVQDLAGAHNFVTTFRTLRNAVDRAGPNGAVYVLELAPLRRVNFADFRPGTVEYRALARVTDRQRTLFRELGPATARSELVAEHTLAERQMIAWSERAIAIERHLANTE